MPYSRPESAEACRGSAAYLAKKIEVETIQREITELADLMVKLVDLKEAKERSVGA